MSIYCEVCGQYYDTTYHFCGGTPTIPEPNKIERLQRENIELKSKLENIKYLDRDVEMLSAEFHKVYQQEAKRQAKATGERYKLKYPNDYNKLPEKIKEFDRVLARYVLSLAIPNIKEEDIIDVLGRKVRHLIANEEYDNFQTQDGSMTIDEKHTIIKEKTFERIRDIAKEILNKINQ